MDCISNYVFYIIRKCFLRDCRIFSCAKSVLFSFTLINSLMIITFFFQSDGYRQGINAAPGKATPVKKACIHNNYISLQALLLKNMNPKINVS